MARILVTGGAGFVASDLALKLAADPENEVVVVDNLLTGDVRKLPHKGIPNLHFIKCDVCLLYTSPSPRDRTRSRMPSSA